MSTLQSSRRARTDTASTPTSAPTPAPTEVTEASASAWRIVTVREMVVKLRDRNFIISTIVLLVLLAGSFGIQAFMLNRSSTTTVAVSSDAASQIIDESQSAARNAGLSIDIRASVVDSSSAVDAAVRSGDADAGLIESNGVWRLVGDSDRNTTVDTWVRQTLRNDAVAANAVAAGTTIEQLDAGSNVQYDLLNPDGDHRYETSRISGTVFGLLFYIAALIFGTAIANSVVEEKLNRVVEILSAAIPIRQLLVGKVVANTILAVGQVILLAALGGAGLVLTGNSDLLSQMTAGVGWYVAFFLVGFVALASLWAVVGSLATRSEDIQSTSPPMTVLTLGIFFLGIFTTGGVLKVLSFVPLLSTIAMPSRVISGDASWVEASASLVISLVGCWAIIRLAERMYRNSLMQTGHRMSYRQALRSDDAGQPA
ncbi:ABC transporter permease [Actinomycetes bacterium M1A6_2h]